MKKIATLVCFALLGCAKTGDSARADNTSAAVVSPSATSSAANPNASQGSAHAVVGQPAPGFQLQDVDGKTVKLDDYKGKVVVLEWYNPHCPFVRASHTSAKGGLHDLPQKAVQ